MSVIFLQQLAVLEVRGEGRALGGLQPSGGLEHPSGCSYPRWELPKNWLGGPLGGLFLPTLH